MFNEYNQSKTINTVVRMYVLYKMLLYYHYIPTHLLCKDYVEIFIQNTIIISMSQIHVIIIRTYNAT
jgi:hypothetical protein